MNDFLTQMNEYVDFINQELINFLPDSSSTQKELVDAMEYSLCSGGKRIRGLLTLACYQMYSQQPFQQAMPFACGVEMIHAYSLIHDDLPCMDDDDMRRGKPSCHIAFGETTALLAGDGLLNRAFEIMSTPEVLSSFDAKRVLQAIHYLSHASGSEGMIDGQVMDLANEKTPADLSRVEQTDLKKTGALIAAAVQMGACIGGASPQEIDLLTDFALKLGLAFQVVDDVLDYTSDEKTLGKPIGSDQSNDKVTYVSLYGIEKAQEVAQRLSTQAKEILKQLSVDVSFLMDLTDLLTLRKK